MIKVILAREVYMDNTGNSSKVSRIDFPQGESWLIDYETGNLIVMGPELLGVERNPLAEFAKGEFVLVVKDEY